VNTRNKAEKVKQNKYLQSTSKAHATCEAQLEEDRRKGEQLNVIVNSSNHSCIAI